MHFSDAGWFAAVGLGCVPIGVVAGVVGIVRYRKMATSIRRLRQRSGSLASAMVPGASVPTIDSPRSDGR